jgi:hypothetical protein
MQKQGITCGKGGPGGATLTWATQVSVGRCQLCSAQVLSQKGILGGYYGKYFERGGGNVGIVFFNGSLVKKFLVAAKAKHR